MSRLTRISILLAGFFALDKALAFVRSIILTRQFGFSHDFDAFNVANNIPDMLFALISGGALAMAFIPVLTETFTQKGRAQAWSLFSKVANIAFLVTGGLAIIVALLANTLVRSQIGIAPGFSDVHQGLVVDLMRLDLIATMIFTISGLVIAGLQANQHFLLPAMAPLFYNIGLIFGAVVLSPEQGYSLGPITLPAFGFGIYGLVYGTILGAALHLGIQVPGLIRFGYRWSPGLGLNTPEVRRVLWLIGPRLGTMLMIQLTFLVRDNFASRLGEGSVSALSLGYMLSQVPETLIGTAIGTALLPTLSQLASSENRAAFQATVQRAMQVILAVTLPIAVLLGIGLQPLAGAAFDLGPEKTLLLMWVTRGFLFGLAGECLLEVAARSFYARQDSITPLATSAVNFLLFTILGAVLFPVLGVAGISLSISIAITTQAVILLVLLNRRLVERLSAGPTIIRAVLAAALGGAIVWAIIAVPFARSQPLVAALAALAVGSLFALIPIWKEVRMLLRL